jgi:hypothetical protein
VPLMVAVIFSILYSPDKTYFKLLKKRCSRRQPV